MSNQEIQGTTNQADKVLGGTRCSTPEPETPIELLRFGPPPFDRLAAMEDAMIDSIEGMSKEEIEAELREAGIDMASAIAKMHAMIEAKKKELRDSDGSGSNR